MCARIIVTGQQVESHNTYVVKKKRSKCSIIPRCTRNTRVTVTYPLVAFGKRLNFIIDYNCLLEEIWWCSTTFLRTLLPANRFLLALKVVTVSLHVVTGVFFRDFQVMKDTQPKMLRARFVYQSIKLWHESGCFNHYTIAPSTETDV